MYNNPAFCSGGIILTVNLFQIYVRRTGSFRHQNTHTYYISLSQPEGHCSSSSLTIIIPIQFYNREDRGMSVFSLKFTKDQHLYMKSSYHTRDYIIVLTKPLSSALCGLWDNCPVKLWIHDGLGSEHQQV